MILVVGGIVAHLDCAATTNQLALKPLVQRHLPGCELHRNTNERFDALVSTNGTELRLAAASNEQPQPGNDVIGYWFSPAMNFIAAQEPRISSPQDAIELVQLLHLLRWGPGFVQQKLYKARSFGSTWIVQVEHDFARYRAMVPAEHPYELQVDRSGKVSQFRQRCYPYLGAATTYTNTVISAYNREMKRNQGRNYPEALFKDLREAWEKEKEPSP